MRSVFILALAATLGCASGWDAAETPHHYEIPDYGTLTLDLPAGVTENISSASGEDALYITLGTRVDDPVLAVGVRLPEPQDPGAHTAESIRGRFASTGVELMQLGSPEARGYYFVRTDPSYKPGIGEFRYMMVGGLGVDDLLVRFTLLTNDTDSPDVRRALTALEGARARKR